MDVDVDTIKTGMSVDRKKRGTRVDMEKRDECGYLCGSDKKKKWNVWI